MLKNKIKSITQSKIRQRKENRRDLKRKLRDEDDLHFAGIYSDGRKSKTLVQERKGNKLY